MDKNNHKDKKYNFFLKLELYKRDGSSRVSMNQSMSINSDISLYNIHVHACPIWYTNTCTCIFNQTTKCQIMRELFNVVHVKHVVYVTRTFTSGFKLIDTYTKCPNRVYIL